MIIRILIVDDEAPIRDYIRHCVEKADMGFEVIDAVNSGHNALRVLNNHQVDLVLSDITMPRMNGLELLENIRERWPQVEVVMLTCHDDFSFVRGAMKFGACDYILKNEISPKVMKEILGRFMEKRTRSDPEEMIARRMALGQYIYSLIADQERETMPAISVKDLVGADRIHSYFVCIFSYDSEFGERSQGIRQPWIQWYWTIPVKDQYVLLLVDLVRGGGSERVENLRRFRELIQGRIERATGFSGVYTSLDDFDRAVLSAKKDLLDEFYEVKNLSEVRSEAQSSAKQKQEGEKPDGDGLDDLSTYSYRIIEKLSLHNWVAAREMTDSMFSFARERRSGISLLKKSLSFILEISGRKAAVNDDHLQRIARSGYVTELIEMMRAYYDELRETKKTYSVQVENALQFINNNYSQSISLNDVSKVAFLNTEYFSRLFKKEVGINFSEYLMDLRMKKARYLLNTTGLSISDIISRIGLTNASHFTASYKKWFGETPSDTRKQ